MTGFHIEVSRLLLPYVLNGYLPTALLVMSSWISFLVSADMVPGRMALLVTLLLMLINISGQASAVSPTRNKLDALSMWMLACTVFITAALFEYAYLLRIIYHGCGKALKTDGNTGSREMARCKVRMLLHILCAN